MLVYANLTALITDLVDRFGNSITKDILIVLFVPHLGMEKE
jgi:hypothetical protein